MHSSINTELLGRYKIVLYIGFPVLKQIEWCFTYNIESLTQIRRHSKYIISGRSVYKRFSSKEQPGLIKGGSILVEAFLIARRETQPGEPFHIQVERQNKEVERYARKTGIWQDNTEDFIIGIYGGPIGHGSESIIYRKDKNTVIKVTNLCHYTYLQKALDSITLHNTYFSETAIKVTGFGRNRSGDFQIINEQPYFTDSRQRASTSKINAMLKQKGFYYIGNILKSIDPIDISDVNDHNVIQTPEGKLFVIDTVMALLTAKREYGGKREIRNEIETTIEFRLRGTYVLKRIRDHLHQICSKMNRLPKE